MCRLTALKSAEDEENCSLHGSGCSFGRVLGFVVQDLGFISHTVSLCCYIIMDLCRRIDGFAQAPVLQLPL